MPHAEKERLIKSDISSIENRVRHAFNQGYDLGYKDGLQKNIKTLPPVNPLSKTGHWINNQNGTISCSHCQTWFNKDDRYSYMRHCPYCNVKMQEVEE